MYLKSIEVNGFKSFANKIVFKFNHGITCIVGPNGSGKSNVADAVRWVLGEQSAKSLRGSKMEDVIFSGTQLRKPQGSAYVAITLDNSDHSLPIDYNEVTVARRVYRSGESEYLINGTVSRLKDVYSLFFDTGIGKEGYSIIGQGQIEKILNGKPEERRELFDEAAGIVKFNLGYHIHQCLSSTFFKFFRSFFDVCASLSGDLFTLSHLCSPVNNFYAFFKTFQIVYSEETIPCDSLVRIPL